MPGLHRTRLERLGSAPAPAVSPDLSTPVPSKTTEVSAVSERPAASRPSGTRPLPAITLRLPAVDPADTSVQTFHTRATPARLPAVRKPGTARLPVTTLRLPALHPAPPEQETQRPVPRAQRDLVFIAGAGETTAAKLARWKTSTRVRVLFRLALMLLAILLLLGAQGFVSKLTRDCLNAQASQQARTCLTWGFFSPLSADNLYNPPTAPHAPMNAAPAMPPVPNDLPADVYAFVKLALPYAFQAHRVLGWQTSVILAQWGLEQGWHVPSYTGYNWGNVSYVPGAPTVGGLNMPGSPRSFAYAPTPADGLRYFLYAASQHYYVGVTAAARYGADATAVALGKSPWDAGHYTNNGHPGSSLLAIMRKYNFYRFDT